MELTLIHDYNGIHDNIARIIVTHLKEAKHIMILIFEMIVTPPTTCRPSMNFPALDHVTQIY